MAAARSILKGQRLLIILKKQDPNRDVVRRWSLDRR
jgi:hypothetical protein